jgi:hypothetical protein
MIVPKNLAFHQLFLELLVGLLADPTGFDGTVQLFERRVAGQIAEVVFALAGGAMLADQPDLFAGKMLLAKVTDALRRAVSHPHAHGSKPRRQLAPCTAPPANGLRTLRSPASPERGAKGRRAHGSAWPPPPATGKIMAPSAGYTFCLQGMPTAQIRPRSVSASRNGPDKPYPAIAQHCHKRPKPMRQIIPPNICHRKPPRAGNI